MLALAAILAMMVFLSAPASFAQTGGQGAIQGTVTDATGAVIPNATVTATDEKSGVSTTRKTSSAGLFTITPLIPDPYTVTVRANGFKVSKQQRIIVNGLAVTGYNPKLSVGSADTTITVTEAPPAMNTVNPTLGAVIDNRTYESLPVLMNNQQRDPTAFATLAPGAQGGARLPIIGGTGNYLAESYVDGMPTTTSNMQGDNRVVSNSIPIEAVDQMQVVTSSPSAEYQGAGAVNFTTKSGGRHYHGTVADFVRNTAFDTWGFLALAQTKLNAQGQRVPAGKPIEHQNEFEANIGGPIPFTRHKGFFFFAFDKFHGRKGVDPAEETVPTALMKKGDFSELLGTDPKTGSPNGQIYDPLSAAECTANNGGAPCRYQFGYGPGGAPIGAPNVMPANEISPIAQYMEKFMPDPTSSGLVDNYLAGSGVSGYDNWEVVAKGDYDLTSSQRLSFLFTHGVRKSVGYGATLPLPYTSGDTSIISPTVMMLEHSIVITPHMVNQFKYGFSRFPQPVMSPTYGVHPYTALDAGITNLPAGQASNAFPGTKFSGSTLFPDALTTWTEDGASDAVHDVVPNAYTLIDNFQWSKGRHSMTFGIQMQWLEDNTSSQSTPSGILQTTYSANDTANFIGNSLNSTSTGYAYASYLLGAVNSAGTTIQSFYETGGRYRPISPYFQDDWKVTPNLTLNLGLRYDYIPPYHEVEDRFSFFNPNATNPLTGSPGLLEFAGNRGADISCQCRTPVHTYWKNWGPRLGFAYSLNEKTVIRGGYALAYSRAGGTGGRAGDSTGTGQGGFTGNLVLPSAVTSGVNAGPSFYLNNSAAFSTAGMANTSFGGPGFVLPTPTAPSAAALTNGTGNYVNSSGKFVSPGGAPAYADPYLSGRAPEFDFFNFGVERAITSNITFAIDYAGSQAHFVAGAGVPGFWSGQLDPQYVAVFGSVVASDNTTNILNAPATPANIAIAQSVDPSIQAPYPGYAAAGAISKVPTIGRMLQPFPQYSKPPSPEWDNIANVSYNALEITLSQRAWKGLSYTLNYTYSKNIGDDGTTRSAFPVPAAVSSSGVALPGNNRADRSLTTIDTPQILHLYGVDQLPFGRGHIGGDHLLTRALLGGWALSGIFSYNSGTPLLITGSGCTTPSAGTCMPDINPAFSGSLRKNGSWGKGDTAANMHVQYLDPDAFTVPQAFALPAGANSNAVPVTKIGDAPRSAALNAWNPSKYNIDMSLRRSFNLTSERVKFIFQVDCTNITNKVTFGGINTTWSPNKPNQISSFGQATSASGSRDFQFSGRINF